MGKNNGKERRDRELFAEEVAEETEIKAWKYNRNLIETSLDPLVTIGADGIVTDANSAIEKAAGLPREQIIGTEFLEYFTDPDKARAGYKQVFSDGRITDYELYLKHINGSSIPVLYNASVYRNNEGQVLGVFAAARDISAIKKYENELIDLRNNLESIIQQKTAELVIANEELSFQNAEKEKLAAELVIANEELSFQNAEKEKRAAELIIANKELIKSQNCYKAITQTSIDGFFILDIKGHFLEVNDAYCTISGYSRKDLLSMSIKDIDLDKVENQVEEHIGKIVEKGWDQFESRHRKADGTVFYVNNSITYIPKEEILICFLHDITERKLQEARLNYLSYHDILTGLYNRTFFEEEIKRLDVNRQLPLAVIMGDINGLKLINDSFGHEAGDQAIIEVANIIKSCCREEDIIARIGGDEFCVLLPKSDENVIRRICQQIYDKCRQQDRKIKGVSILYSISLGFTKRTVAHEQVEVVMKDAEAEMYRHKLLETRSLRCSIVSSIISTLKERYIETEAHSERLKKLCRAIGAALGVSEAMLDDLELLSTLHDIGKIAISDAIINKQSGLTDEEKKEMRSHTAIGYNITQSTIEFQQISEYILDHHEKWDGSGYPRQLKGEEIPLLSRIIAVADSYDAMINDRPYRKALSEEYAINEIRACAGTQFDPVIARVFIEKVLGKVW